MYLYFELGGLIQVSVKVELRHLRHRQRSRLINTPRPSRIHLRRHENPLDESRSLENLPLSMSTHIRTTICPGIRKLWTVCNPNVGTRRRAVIWPSKPPEATRRRDADVVSFDEDGTPAWFDPQLWRVISLLYLVFQYDHSIVLYRILLCERHVRFPTLTVRMLYKTCEDIFITWKRTWWGLNSNLNCLLGCARVA